MDTIGSRLKEERERLGMTQEDLERITVENGLRVSQSLISALESGSRNRCRSDKLLALGRALGLNPEYLVNGSLPKHWSELSEEADDLMKIHELLTPEARKSLLAVAKAMVK